MFALISFRAYIGIGVVVGIIVYLIGLVAGPQVVNFFTQLEATALVNGVSPFIATMVLGPFIFAFSEPLFGAILAGLLWPLILVWLVLLFLVLIISAFMGGYNSAASGTDQFN